MRVDDQMFCLSESSDEIRITDLGINGFVWRKDLLYFLSSEGKNYDCAYCDHAASIPDDFPETYPVTVSTPVETGEVDERDLPIYTLNIAVEQHPLTDTHPDYSLKKVRWIVDNLPNWQRDEED